MGDAENRPHDHTLVAIASNWDTILNKQKMLYENHNQYLTRSQKLQQRKLGPFTVTKRITNTTYRIQQDQDPTNTKTVHRNQSVECYPKEGSIQAMIEEYVAPDHHNDNFYERFMAQGSRDFNKSSATEEHVSLPFPIQPLQSVSSTDKRSDFTHTVAIRELSLHLLFSNHQRYRLQLPLKLQLLIHLLQGQPKFLSRNPEDPLPQSNNFFRNSVKLRTKELK